MRALVIEDSATVRKILCEYLRQLNIQTVEAADGRQGLERLREAGQLDLVLVDWDMPVMDGIEFIRAVRNLRIYDPLPLIMVTTRLEKDHLETANGAGVNEYIQKPCTVENLREKLGLLGLLTT
jgi:two-component system, chemotaxis family, chemotaxis protein CheY